MAVWPLFRIYVYGDTFFTIKLAHEKTRLTLMIYLRRRLRRKNNNGTKTSAYQY